MNIYPHHPFYHTPLISSSSGFSVIDSSLGSSLLFFRMMFPDILLFYQNVLLLFLSESRCSVLHYIFEKKLRTSQSVEKKWRYTCMIQTRNILFENTCHQWFINYLHCWIYSSYILHKKLNKVLQGPVWPFFHFEF